jgi:hypothetical protein
MSPSKFFAPLSLLFIGVGIGFLLAAPSSHAEELDFEEKQACFGKVQTFLSSFLSTDSAKDYWADIFKRNACQQQDIFAIDEEIDALLLELYETSCSVSEFTELENEIREKKMELYFVRHIVEVEEDTYFEKDVEATPSRLEPLSSSSGEEQSIEDSPLFEEMVNRYVYGKKTDWVTKDELAELFERWTGQYEDRVESYLSCDESPWQEVADKTRDFLETLKEIKESFEKDTKAMKDEFEETTKARLRESGVLNANGEFVGMGSAIKSYLKKNIQVQLSNLPSKQTLAEIEENFAALGQMLSTEDAYKALANEESEYAELSSRAELISKYTFLYQQAGTEITVLLRNKITGLREVVRMSTDGIKLDTSSTGTGNLKQLQTAAKDIWKKQGKTSVKP